MSGQESPSPLHLAKVAEAATLNRSGPSRLGAGLGGTDALGGADGSFLAFL